MPVAQSLHGSRNKNFFLLTPDNIAHKYMIWSDMVFNPDFLKLATTVKFSTEALRYVNIDKLWRFCWTKFVVSPTFWSRVKYFNICIGWKLGQNLILQSCVDKPFNLWNMAFPLVAVSSQMFCFCPRSGKYQNQIFNPHNNFVSMVCNEHCSLMGLLTRQETICVFFHYFCFDCYILWSATFVYLHPHVCAVCELFGRVGCWVRVLMWLSFVKIRYLVFESLVNFSHHFSCMSFSVFF